MDIDKKEWLRSASSGLEDIMSVRWSGESPRAVIQLAHGMAEHTARYDDFASFLVSKGFAVYMNEYAGHGRHAKILGYFAENNGMDYVIADIKSLEETARQENPGLPVFIMGHSMGSFIVRKYITIYGAGLAGCILSGTAGKNKAVGGGLLVASLQKKIKGPTSTGKMLTAMSFGSYTKKIENPVNAHAWLSRDDEICRAYKDDKYCGFKFTASGFYDLLTLLKEINAKGWEEKVPKTLPVYLFAGAEDPVGDYGNGVIEVYERLKKTGLEDLNCKLYPGGRHEMLNELNKQEVYGEVIEWLDARV